MMKIFHAQTRIRNFHIIILLLAGITFFPGASLASIDAPHNQCNNISCESCHNVSLPDSPLLAGSDINNFCTANCHSSLSAPYTDTSAPIARTHMDKICTDCHNPHIQGQKYLKNKNADDFYLTEGQIDGYTYNSGPKTTTINYSGATFKSGKSLESIVNKSSSQRHPILLPNIGKLGWSFSVTAMDDDTITVKGDLTPVYTYVTPPTTFAIIMGQYLNQYIDADDDGFKEKEIKFFDHDGDCSWSFAYDESSTGTDPSPNGVCQACHATTGHWKNDGTQADHFNTIMTCVHCHPHANGFAYGYSADDPGCDDCHGHDDGFGGGTYAGTTQSHSAHMENDSDDLKGPHIGCSDCHDTDFFPYFADSATTLAATTVCNPCHSPGGAFNGVNSTAQSVGAKDNWRSGIYTGSALATGKEKWCDGCHDGGTAFSHPTIVPDVIVDNEDPDLFSVTGTWNVYSDSCVYVGNNFHYHPANGGAYSATWQVPPTLPAGTYNVYGIWCANSYREDEVYYTVNRSGGSDVVGPFNQQLYGGAWRLLGTFTFDAGSGAVVVSGGAVSGIISAEAIKFENVDFVGAYAPNVTGDNVTNGYYVTGHKLTCTVCHDAGSKHIDHNPRTYEVVEATGTAITPYEEGYRLRDVFGQRAMVIPREMGSSINPADFTLCFKCHDSNAVLSTSPNGTNFYNNDASPLNSHPYHLGMTGKFFDSDWDAIIGSTNCESCDSSASCTTCHNVHGSLSAKMIRRGELISTYGTTNKVPAIDFCYLDDVESRNCSIVNPFPASVGGSMLFLNGYPEGGNAVCKGCHTGYKYYYRTAKDIAKPTNPVVYGTRVAPTNVANDGTESALFTAQVVDPNEDLSSVVIDLSSLGESPSQAMYDDGTNGDLIAGDEVYSYLLSGTTVGVGNKTVTITATDELSNAGTRQAVLVVHNQYGTYIVDDEDSDLFSVTGTWATWNASCVYFGTMFHYHNAAPGAYSATWQVRSDMPAATYKVYAIWCANSYREEQVYYTVNHSGGPTVVGPFNQKQNGGVWMLLGTFTFDAGSGSVVVSGTDNAGVVSAEAIKWEPQP